MITANILKRLLNLGATRPRVRLDSSSRIHGIRTIQFRRKNRPNWTSIDADTISSFAIGYNKIRSNIVLVQGTLPIQALPTDFDKYKNEDGLIQIDKLSADNSSFLAFLAEEKDVSYGGAFTVTLPTSERIADLLQTNQYEKYSNDDFVRARAVLSSTINYNKGFPIRYYWFGLRPDSSDLGSKLEALLASSEIKYRITATEPLIKANVFPSSSEPRVVKGSKYSLISEAKLGAQPISISTATGSHIVW